MPATPRKAVAKRKAAAKPTTKPKQRMVAFLLPDELIAEIDAIAREESRSRARMIEVGMRQFVQSYQRGRAAA